MAPHLCYRTTFVSFAIYFLERIEMEMSFSFTFTTNRTDLVAQNASIIALHVVVAVN